MTPRCGMRRTLGLVLVSAFVLGGAAAAEARSRVYVQIGPPAPIAGSEARAATRWLCLGSRLLRLESRRISLGRWILGEAAATARSVDWTAVGPRAARLVYGARALALTTQARG